MVPQMALIVDKDGKINNLNEYVSDTLSYRYDMGICVFCTLQPLI